jgi:glyoxylase-like metal-dependent hydrolase (beta-lactamase superfamily II)
MQAARQEVSMSAPTWTLGSVRITSVKEIELPIPGAGLVPEATPERLARHPWLAPRFVTPAGELRLLIQALVVESQGRRIVVDTCVGNDKPRTIPGWNLRQGGFLGDLAAAGFPAETIDTVICTHLHVDHVGWNTRLVDGVWVPTFPKARYLIQKSEFAHWDANEEKVYGDVMGDSVRPVLDAGLADLVGADVRIAADVSLEPTPGHTPGHVSVHVESRGEEAWITGDLMHHPAQCAHPEWVSRADVDPDLALRTRRRFLERCAATGPLVLGTHFAGPTAGRIVRDGDAFRFAV